MGLIDRQRLHIYTGTLLPIPSQHVSVLQRAASMVVHGSPGLGEMTSSGNPPV